jgi:hypothetical protein
MLLSSDLHCLACCELKCFLRGQQNVATRRQWSCVFTVELLWQMLQSEPAPTGAPCWYSMDGRLKAVNWANILSHTAGNSVLPTTESGCITSLHCGLQLSSYTAWCTVHQYTSTPVHHRTTAVSSLSLLLPTELWWFILICWFTSTECVQTFYTGFKTNNADISFLNKY